MWYRIQSVMYILLLLAFSVAAQAGEVWKITSLEWPPYSGSALPSRGSSIQKLERLLRQEGIELQVEYYPWARAQDMAAQQGYVGYYPAWPDEVYDGFTASPPVDWSVLAVMANDEYDVLWCGLENIFTKKVGLISNYGYPPEIGRFVAAYPETVDMTPNEVALVRKLSEGRISTAITDPSVMYYLAKQEGIHNVRTLKILGRIGLVVAFRNDEENLKRLHLLEMLLKERHGIWPDRQE